jgi:hypothetical protein
VIGWPASRPSERLVGRMREKGRGQPPPRHCRLPIPFARCRAAAPEVALGRLHVLTREDPPPSITPAKNGATVQCRPDQGDQLADFHRGLQPRALLCP